MQRCLETLLESRVSAAPAGDKHHCGFPEPRRFVSITPEQSLSFGTL